MTIEWLQTWISPLFWAIIDLAWIVVGILLCRILGGKICMALIAAASFSLFLSLFSVADSYYGNINGSQILPYESPLYFILWDIGWPFSLLCVAICVGILTIRIHTIVRRNKELETLVANSLPSPKHRASE